MLAAARCCSRYVSTSSARSPSLAKFQLATSKAAVSKGNFSTRHAASSSLPFDRVAPIQRHIIKSGFKTTSKIPDGTPAIFLKRAELEIEVGRLEKAIEIIDQGLSTFPNEHFLLKKKASCLRLQTKFSEAVSALDQLIENFPDDMEALLEKAECLLFLDRFAEALQITKTVLGKDGRNVNALHLRAMAVGRLLGPEEMLVWLDETLRVDTNHTNSLTAKGVALCLLSRYELAAKFLKEAIKRSAENTEAWIWLGEAYFLSGKHQNALDCFNKALSIDASIPQAQKGVNKCVAVMQIPDDVQDTLKMMQKRAKENPVAKIGLAIFELTQTRIYDDELFEEIYRNDPKKSAELLLEQMLVDQLQAIGMHEKAALWIQRAIDHNPNEPRLLAEMSRAVLRLGRYEEALMWLHRAQELLAQQHHHMTHKEEQKQPEGEKSEKEVWKNFRGQLHDRKQEIVRMQQRITSEILQLPSKQKHMV